jgi:hypothetical protein
VYCHWFGAGPSIRVDEPFHALPIPRSCVAKGKLRKDLLEEHVLGKLGHEDSRAFLETQVLRVGNSSAAKSACAWRLASVAYRNEAIRRAIRHIVDSEEDFHVYPGEIPEVLENARYTGSRWWEWTRLERAMISVYSAVEALIGDPPRKDSKLCKKLRETHHLDPDVVVGELLHLQGMTLAEMIRQMQQARDHRAAHGSTREGSLMLAELLEFQSLARLLVMEIAEDLHGQPLFPPSKLWNPWKK